MLGVGDKFPRFELQAVKAGRQDDKIKDAFETISNENHSKWLVIFFWPKDFTFVCPTEIVAFGELNKEFADRDATLLGASVDSEFVHLEWKKRNNTLTDLPFPMLSDFKRELSTSLGILDRDGGFAQRATYIVDPEGIIRFVLVNDSTVGRNPSEVLRTLDALKNGGLCPCNWKKGEDTIQV